MGTYEELCHSDLTKAMKEDDDELEDKYAVSWVKNDGTRTRSLSKLFFKERHPSSVISRATPSEVTYNYVMLVKPLLKQPL